MQDKLFYDDQIMVTVHTLVYNHEPYLRDCLNGIVMQKTNFRFEAVIHDDCSTDHSADIIREYAIKYPHIIKPVFEKENQYSKGKESQTHNNMYALTRGKYIAYCEVDDYWIDPNKLQIQVDFLESHPEYSMCFHDAKVKAEEGRDWYDCFGKLENRDYSATELIKYWKVPTCSIVARKDVVNKIPNNDKYRMGDNILVMTCLTYGKVRCIAKKMGVYRLTPTGWLGTHSGKKNCYDFISHYKGMVEDFPLCRCEEMYHNMENKYFELLSILRQEGNFEEFEHVKDDYMSFPGTTHWEKFKRYYYTDVLRQKVKRLLGHRISLIISRLKAFLKLND